ncbi:MAG: GC-type dockerin domain-anchored protein [Planctomycetota bacterium]
MSSTSVDTTSDSLSLSFVLLEFGLDDFDIDGDGRFSSLDLALVDAAGDLATTTDPMVVSYFDLDGDGMIENSAPSGGGFFAGSSPGTEIEVAMKTIANMRIVLAADYEAGVFGDLDGDDDADCDDLAIGETGYPFVSLGNALYNTRFDVDLDGVIDQNDREAFFDLLQPGDVTTTGSSLPGGPGFGIPDGVVDLDDLGWYLSRWLALDPVADLTTAGATLPSQPGAGIPDGQVTLDDLGYFQTIWLGSCP